MENNNNAREAILNRIRKGKPAAIEAPKIPHFTWPGNPVDNFCKQLKAFDGNYMMFDSREAALAWLKDNIDTSSKVVCSALPDYKGSVTAADYPDPHKCTNIDICVVEALMGVGEMGSVFVTDTSLGSPACALLCTDLYVLLDKSKIVDGIHTAYRQLDLTKDAYSSLFSGPSATADIEAVHVTGAQAEISLTALLY